MPDTAELARSRAAQDVPTVKMLIGGDWREGAETYDVIDPYRNEVVARAPRSSLTDVTDAVSAAVEAKAAVAAIPAYERAALLRRVHDMIDGRADEIAEIGARETGKAVSEMRIEVTRSKDTASLSADEAIKIQGEHMPLDSAPQGAGKIAMLLRFPVGVVAGITPFNAPFNLALHKIAPAFAAGNAMVLKPPPQAPMTVHKLIEMFVDAGMPPGALNVVYGDKAGPALVADPRVDFITFTGSNRAGAEIKARSGMRRVALELGGNGPNIVHGDADLDKAASLCARNAMKNAGQSCISVQTIYVHADVFEPFKTKLVELVRAIKVGDPLDSATEVGTLIDEPTAARIQEWVAEAVADGAVVEIGGTREGALFQPTVLTGISGEMRVVCEEIFGPVVNLTPYTSLDDVFAAVNKSRFGLHCGIFTKSLDVGFRAIREIRTGGVVIDGPSTWRIDQMAYGGIKDSGLSREGPRYAIRDMTDERLVIFNL